MKVLQEFSKRIEERREAENARLDEEQRQRKIRLNQLEAQKHSGIDRLKIIKNRKEGKGKETLRREIAAYESYKNRKRLTSPQKIAIGAGIVAMFCLCAPTFQTCSVEISKKSLCFKSLRESRGEKSTPLTTV